MITGRVLKAYGVLGWVKVEVLSANPRRFLAGNAFLVQEEEGMRRLELEAVKPAPGALLVKFLGVDDREGAGHLAGKELLVDAGEQGEPPEGSFWEHDLLDLTVVTEEGRCLGEVTEVLETGSNDVLVVQGEEECLIPMTREVVRSVDLEAGTITVRLLPGLLEE